MDEERLRQEGAFIIEDRPAPPPRLICGQCGSREIVGEEVKVSGQVAAVRIVCKDCGTVYFVVGSMVEAEVEREHGG